MKYKRLIFSLLLVTMCATATAQYGSYYYHRTGDTIYTNPDNGYFSWWDFEYFSQNNMGLYVDHPGTLKLTTDIIVQKFFTPLPLRIIGLAGCVASYRPYDAGTHETHYLPSPQQEYFYLYDYDSTGLVFKGRLAWDATDSHRTLMLPYNKPNNVSDTCCFNEHRIADRPLYEYYFDTSFVVSDTFYVGGSYYSNFHNSPMDTCTGYYYARAAGGMFGHNPHFCIGDAGLYPTGMDVLYSQYSTESPCYFPFLQYMRCSDTGTMAYPDGSYVWRADTMLAAMLVYPIVQVDTTVPPTYLCDSVQNLEASVDSGGCLTVTWDDFMHYSYCEVEYYALQDGYGSRVQQTVYGSNILTICGLDAGKQWYVRVRAYCDTSKQETSWTPWLAAGRDMPTAVGGPSDLARFTNVMPNPATGRVTVTSCFGMRSVEVYNMRGLLVYSDGTPWYTSKSIDLAGWAPGQYVVIIETPAGKTAKRMTVVR